MMARIAFSFAIGVAAFGLRAQGPTLLPELLAAPDLSPENRARYAWYVDALNGKVEPDPARMALYDSLFLAIGETRESPCEIIGYSCSWYCGGGPDSIWATSTLAPVGDRTYIPENAHDLDYCTAWSEGAQGPGIGERLSYRFANDSPRLHTLFVANGLITNEKAWSANNRVKRLSIEENGVQVAILDLRDTMAPQEFKLPRLFGQRADGQPMLLTFTILAVYKGDRFDDTVITEIWFDGTDVH